MFYCSFHDLSLEYLLEKKRRKVANYFDFFFFLHIFLSLVIIFFSCFRLFEEYLMIPIYLQKLFIMKYILSGSMVRTLFMKVI